jgi:GNAT superfamily N-acetyltransferase
MIVVREEWSLPEEETQRIYDGLLATDPPSQPRNYTPLLLSLRDAEARLVGGVLGSTAWSWLSVEALWVDVKLRGQGRGRELLAAAERIARERGCMWARLDTFDFQARGFYERAGYAVYA